MILADIHIGEKLKEVVENYCADRGIDKQEIAKRIGVNPSALSSIFRSPQGTPTNILKVCGACELKAYAFWAWLETGIQPDAWAMFESIMTLPSDDRKYILSRIRSDMQFMAEQRKKSVDGEK